MCLPLYHTYTSWQERTLSSLASWHFIILLDLFFCFANSDHVMFSREFLSLINYAYICSWIPLQNNQHVFWNEKTKHICKLIVYCLIKVLMHITYCYRCSTLACITGPLRSVHTWRQVAATRCSDTSQQQIASCVLENFCENLCLRNKSQKIKSDRICATCCCEKTLLQRQRFSPNFSCTHKAICRCDVSP